MAKGSCNRFNETIERLFRAAFFVSLIAVLLTAACTYACAEDKAEAEDNLLYITCTVDYERAYEVLDMINSHRGSDLTMDSELQDAALTRAVETILYFEHARPNGGEWNSQNARVKGENLGMGSGSASRLMRLWMDSQGHRENILRSSFHSIGVACIEYNGTYYWVQCFGNDSGDGGKKGETGAASVGIDLPGDDEYAIIHLNYKVSRYMEGEYSESEAGEEALRVDVGESMDLGLIGDGWIEFDTTKINWKSSDESVATVIEDGTLHITGPGAAKITAASGSIDRASFELISKYNMKEVFILDDSLKPIVLSKYGLMLYGRDYTMARLTNEDAGTGKTIIRGKGDYRGLIEKTFETKTP